jgi:hypothetical protein
MLFSFVLERARFLKLDQSIKMNISHFLVAQSDRSIAEAL